MYSVLTSMPGLMARIVPRVDVSRRIRSPQNAGPHAPVECATTSTQLGLRLSSPDDKIPMPLTALSEIAMSDAAEPTITLWRPVGPEELALIEAADMRAFPPRLPEQPIFYPVLTEDYAVKIARDWNVPASGRGHVVRFEVQRSFLERYDVREAGGREHLEYWIPSEDLVAFNAAIVGVITLVRTFP